MIEQGMAQITYNLPSKTRYVSRLKRMVKARRGKLDEFVLVSIERTAGIWMNVDKLEAELAHSPSMVMSLGSTGQTRAAANPLYDKYISMNRILFDHLKGLGLNYSISPENVNEADTDVNDDYPMARFMKGQ
ncbi:MAG: hypothetical protein LUD72_03870 [Bacteroidales bacterium]|nr:hypothetical protein [Bacteroidales bacterium]